MQTTKAPTPSTTNSSPTIVKPLRKTAQGQKELVAFDLRSCRQKRELLSWCKEKWADTFHPSITHRNPLFFNSCCGSFTRRWYAKSAAHPPLESCSIMKIPSFSGVTNADELYKWLLMMLSQNHKAGRPCYFPSINTPHVEIEDPEDQLDQEEAELLNKRVQDISKKLQHHEKRLKDLEGLGKVNQQLLSSSRAWHSKYQELLEQNQNGCPEEFVTPVKKNVSCLDVYEYSY